MTPEIVDSTTTTEEPMNTLTLTNAALWLLWDILDYHDDDKQLAKNAHVPVETVTELRSVVTAAATAQSLRAAAETSEATS